MTTRCQFVSGRTDDRLDQLSADDAVQALHVRQPLHVARPRLPPQSFILDDFDCTTITATGY